MGDGRRSPRLETACTALVVLALGACTAPNNAGAAPANGRPHAGGQPAGTPERKAIRAAVRPASPAAWTTFRGSPQRTGRASVKGPRRALLAWTFHTEGRIFADAAVAADGTVYVASHDGRLYALDPGGRQKWSLDIGGKIWTSPAVGPDGAVYVGSDADRLVAVDPATGRERWRFVTTQPPDKGDVNEDGRWDVDTSPLVAADGTILFGCHTFLFALRRDGTLGWRFPAGTGRRKIFSSPALGRDGTIYFGTQGREFFALSPEGKALWSLGTGGDNDGTPAVGDDDTIFFGSDDGKLRAVAPGGALRWVADLGGPIRTPVAVGSDGTVLASAYGSVPFLAALDARTGAERWRFAIEPGEGSYYGIQSGALIDAEGYVYFGGRDHFVYCLAPGGKLLWRHETGNQVDSGPVLGPDGTLYVGSDDGDLYAFRAGS